MFPSLVKNIWNAMESLPRDPYERQLLEVFKSCDYDGKGLLDSEGLSKLCELLHLEDGKDELMACLLPHGPSSSVPSVSFAKFRDALLKLLDGIGGDPDKREPSPGRKFWHCYSISTVLKHYNI